MITYYAQVEDYYVNYLFRKDLTYTRLRNTTKMVETIGYTKQQFNIVKRLHPEAIPSKYTRTTRENLFFHRKKLNEL